MSGLTTNPTDRVYQRDDALHKANQVRHARKLLRSRIAQQEPRDGAKLAAQILLHPPQYAQTMTVERLLTAIHSFGSVRAKAIAGSCNARTLRGVSTHDRVRLAVACQRDAAHLKRWNPAPVSNADQARRALDDANRVRIFRAQTLREIKHAPDANAGAWRAAALINNPTRPVELDGLTVKAVLEAIPRVEAATARKIMRPLALADSTRLEMLSRSRSTQVATALLNRQSRLHAATRVADGGSAREQHAFPAAA